MLFPTEEKFLLRVKKKRVERVAIETTQDTYNNMGEEITQIPIILIVHLVLPLSESSRSYSSMLRVHFMGLDKSFNQLLGCNK